MVSTAYRHYCPAIAHPSEMREGKRRGCAGGARYGDAILWIDYHTCVVKKPH